MPGKGGRQGEIPAHWRRTKEKQNQRTEHGEGGGDTLGRTEGSTPPKEQPGGTPHTPCPRNTEESTGGTEDEPGGTPCLGKTQDKAERQSGNSEGGEGSDQWETPAPQTREGEGASMESTGTSCLGQQGSRAEGGGGTGLWETPAPHPREGGKTTKGTTEELFGGTTCLGKAQPKAERQLKIGGGDGTMILTAGQTITPCLGKDPMSGSGTKRPRGGRGRKVKSDGVAPVKGFIQTKISFNKISFKNTVTDSTRGDSTGNEFTGDTGHFTENTEVGGRTCCDHVRSEAGRCEIHGTEFVRRKYRKSRAKDSTEDRRAEYSLEDYWLCELAEEKL